MSKTTDKNRSYFSKLKIFGGKKLNLIIAEVVLILMFAAFTVLRLEGIVRSRLNTKLPKDAQTYLKQADLGYENFDLSQAVLNYWYALKKKPDLIKPHIRISQIFFHKNNWNDDAMIQIDKALKKDPNNAQAHLIRGRLFRDEGLLEGAANEYEKVLELESDNAEAHYRLGLAYQSEQLLDFAIEHYKLAIEADKNLTQLMFESEPIGLQARLALARIYKKDGDRFDDAIELLEEVYDKEPAYEEAKQDLIDLLYTKARSLGRIAHLRLYGKALKVYERIVKIKPTETEAWKWIGQISYYYEDYERALEAYSKAFEIDPGDIDALTYIKTLQLEIQKSDD